VEGEGRRKKSAETVNDDGDGDDGNNNNNNNNGKLYTSVRVEKKRIKKRYSVPLQTVRGQGSAVRTCGVVKDGHTAVFAVARIPICRTDGRRERFPCPSSTSLINRARIRYSIQRAVQKTLLHETHRPRLPSQHAAHTHPPQFVVRGNHIIILCKSN